MHYMVHQKIIWFNFFTYAFTLSDKRLFQVFSKIIMAILSFFVKNRKVLISDILNATYINYNFEVLSLTLYPNLKTCFTHCLMFIALFKHFWNLLYLLQVLRNRSNYKLYVYPNNRKNQLQRA